MNLLTSLISQTEHHNSGSISVHHIMYFLLVGQLELHASIAISHTLFHQQSLHDLELIGHSVAVQDQLV